VKRVCGLDTLRENEEEEVEDDEEERREAVAIVAEAVGVRRGSTNSLVDVIFLLDSSSAGNKLVPATSLSMNLYPFSPDFPATVGFFSVCWVYYLFPSALVWKRER